MKELTVAFDSAVTIRGALCLPEDAAAGTPCPAIVLLGGTGGDTRDGDHSPERSPGIDQPALRGTLRRIAHHLGHHGIATLRYDKRGVGDSGGHGAVADYDADLEDAKAGFRWLQQRPEVDAARVGVAGHSAGALVACLVCRDLPDVACAALLGALYGPIDDLVRWNWARPHRLWETFSKEQRQWLLREQPRGLVGRARVEDFIAAARQGQDTVRLSAYGLEFEFNTVRFRQDLDRPCSAEFRHVYCPALVLHGAEDLNVKVDDCLETFRALRQAGNEDVDLVILPGLDHNFQPASAEAGRRDWDRIAMAGYGRPMSPLALRAISSWAVRVLRPEVRLP